MRIEDNFDNIDCVHVADYHAKECKEGCEQYKSIDKPR